MRRVVIVNDKMQQDYRYELSASVGRDFDPQFRPDLTPKQMLELGVFCGKYLTDCRDEYPASWFARAKLSRSGRDCSLNYFGVDASQPLSEWRRKGWMHADDPRGWFQWYCRYYMGRRLPDEDARQGSTGSLQGLRLGLYIASEIARAHNEMLTTGSSFKETRFTFRMPLQ